MSMRRLCTRLGIKKHHGLRCGSRRSHHFLTSCLNAIHLFLSAGKYMFEKLLSGMFLGEVARRVLLRLAQDPTASLFGRTTATTASGTAAVATVPVVPAPLTQKGGFTTAHLAAIVDAGSASSRAATVNRVLGMQVPRLGQQAVSNVLGAVGR